MLDKHLITDLLLKDEFRRYLCPTCSMGRLCVVEESFTERSSAKSDILISEGAWEPTDAELVFSCMLKCDDANCGEVVACMGDGVIREEFPDFFPEQERELVRYYRPKYFYPALSIVDIPDECPEEILLPIRNSFALVFSSSSAALNSIRIAIEALLTHLKVKRFDIRGGKRLRLSLHN